MLKKILILVSWIICSASFAADNIPAPNQSLAAPKSSLQKVDQIVAIVNDEVITQSQLDTALEGARQQAASTNTQLPPHKELRRILLQQLIYQKLQLQIAKRNNITISNDQLNKTIHAIAQRNHVSISELKEKLAQQGFTFKQFQEQIKNQMIISKLQRQAIGPTVKVSNQDIENFLAKHHKQISHQNQEYHVIDILIADTSAKGLATAKRVSQQLRQGATIAKITSSQITSNDMGWQSNADLPNIFIKTLSKMKQGDVSKPIQAANGYHVLKLLGTRTSTKGQLSKEQIQQVIFQQKFQKALEDWLKKLASQSEVKIINDN